MHSSAQHHSQTVAVTGVVREAGAHKWNAESKPEDTDVGDRSAEWK